MLDTVLVGVARLSQNVFIPPSEGNKAGVPGQNELVQLTQTIRTWAIIACIIAIIIAAILWAWGSQSQNAAQATQGKKGIIVAIAAAAIIFAAEALVNWGSRLGNEVKS